MALTRIIHRYGGTVDKFIGDDIMTFWGAPLPDPDQALHACRAARDMQVGTVELRQKRNQAGLPAIYMRVGIHSGTAVVGNMGSEERFNYTAIGDNVNLASRLASIKKLYGTEVLMSAATAAALRDRLPLRPVDKVAVKGKTQPVEIVTYCPDAELARHTRAAIERYRAQDWDAAATLWQEVLALQPDDHIAQMRLQRIAELRQQPLGPDWNRR